MQIYVRGISAEQHSMNMMPTPPLSRTPSGIKRASPPPSMDFSDLPALIQPSPPSNTLLITNLTDARIFTKPSLAHFQTLITTHCANPTDLYTFSPLRSMSRIILITHTVESAIAIREALDGEMLFSSRIRVYYGEPTQIAELEKSVEERQLQVPKADKQFFISPPPSPPFGWTSREEEPPNKDVHAEDLAMALDRLSRRADAEVQDDVGKTYTGEELAAKLAERRELVDRSSSSTTIVYDPVESGHSPDLPAIAVEDTSLSPGTLTPERMDEGMEGGGRIIAHTSRPPVELMHDA